MTLNRRIERLEASQTCGADRVSILTRTLVCPKRGDLGPVMARLIGRGQTLHRRPEETAKAFEARAQATAKQSNGDGVSARGAKA